MGRRIYVGNLPWSTTSEELTDMFGEYGGVVNAEVLSDRETGRSRGFGFVEMENDEAMQAAIAGLNGKDMGGRALRRRRWWWTRRLRWRRRRLRPTLGFPTTNN
jgi:RNA recognition motif-containing protein